MNMPDVKFDTYYRYKDLTCILKGFVDEYPQLVRLESIGKSYEGRDIWLVAVTNFATGEDRHKPALWVDGNIHASELAPSSLCLYLVNNTARIPTSRAALIRALFTSVLGSTPTEPSWL